MSAVLLHDSGRSGALTWADSLIRARIADGMILNPFSTPREPITRARGASVEGAAGAQARLIAAGGEAYFDPTTHGEFAAGADLWDFYDSWDLWPGVPRGTATSDALAAHVDRVLTHCTELGLRPITEL